MNPETAAVAAVASNHDLLVLIGVLATSLIGVITTSIIQIIKQVQLGRKVEQASEAVAQTHQKIDEQSKAVGAQLGAQDKTLAGIEQTSRAVESQTNGTLAAMQAQLEASRREVAELKAAAAAKEAAKAEAAAEMAAERARHVPVMIADRRTQRPIRRATKGRK